MIRTTINEARQLTIFECIGKAVPEEILATIASVYEGEPTLHQLWDFTEATVHHIPAETIREFVKSVSERMHRREGGKSALVSSEDIGFGLARVYSAVAEINDLKIEVGAFRTVEEALAWIEED